MVISPHVEVYCMTTFNWATSIEKHTQSASFSFQCFSKSNTSIRTELAVKVRLNEQQD